MEQIITLSQAAEQAPIDNNIKMFVIALAVVAAIVIGALIYVKIRKRF